MLASILLHAHDGFELHSQLGVPRTYPATLLLILEKLDIIEHPGKFSSILFTYMYKCFLLLAYYTSHSMFCCANT